MPAPETTRVLRSFDGGVVLPQRVSRPDKYRDLEAVSPDRIRIARGGGYSYAAASFGNSGLVQETGAFDRILSFDQDRGVVECEAGITLQKLYEFLTPAGWYVPVQPGYPLITLGGCIATDVHGKNQYVEGTFLRSVLKVKIFHPKHGVIEGDRDRNRDAFELTCGGFGLSGQILSARIQLQRFPGGAVRLFTRRIKAIDETVSLLQEHAESTPLLYTWHNFSRRGTAFGSGFLYGGEFVSAPMSDSPPKLNRRIDSEKRSRVPLQLLNRSTTPLFNHAYERAQRFAPPSRLVDFYQFAFPVTTKIVFFELFGRSGFHEYQMLLPADGFAAAMAEVKDYVARQKTPVCLASCKLFRGEPSLLRFDGTGVCIALDFPRDRSSEQFARFLDEIVVRYKGIPNISKDSRLPRQVVQSCYPEYNRFRERLSAWDPNRLYRSELSERLGL